MKTNSLFKITVILLLLTWTIQLSAHCDSMEGPVIKDAQKALDNNNVNIVLKWVPKEHEKELINSFEKTQKVRKQNAESKELADNYFFETLVRIHRAGEGVAYTGIKPVGTKIDDNILEADKVVESGKIDHLLKMLPEKKHKEVKKLFDYIVALNKYDVNDVEAGRKWVDANVHFFHFVEEQAEHKCDH